MAAGTRGEPGVSGGSRGVELDSRKALAASPGEKPGVVMASSVGQGVGEEGSLSPYVCL